MLLEVARCRADSDSEEAPAVRQRSWRTWRATLSAARVTPSKILLPKTRPPSPATAGARAAFQDDSARKPSEPSARERSPETPETEDFFCSPQSSVGGAAAALESLAEQLTRVKRAGTSRARPGTRQSPRLARSASPPPPPPVPPPSPARSPRRAAAARARARDAGGENAPTLFASPGSAASPRASGLLRQSDSAAVPKSAFVRKRLDASPHTPSARTVRSRAVTVSKPPRGDSSARERRSVDTAARAVRGARARAPLEAAREAGPKARGAVSILPALPSKRPSRPSRPSRPCADKKRSASSDAAERPNARKTRKTSGTDAPPRRGAYADDELAALRETNPTAYNRILGNRRSAANSKARRDATLASLRAENARLLAENERLRRSRSRTASRTEENAR